MSKFKELLQQSFKSNDTEEWLDVHFTRPIGLVFALFWNRLGVHPNTITILSIFLGIGAGVMFVHTDTVHNVIGIVLLMLANFCDSTDGQMARLTGKKTLIGRMLDGLSGDIWFFCIYVALCIRMQGQNIPFTSVKWGIWIWVMGFIAGILSHSPQSSLSDYYRQIHLFFLKGKAGSELDNYQQQRKVYEQLPKKGHFWERKFYYNYANYCRSQERRTPMFQRFVATCKEKYGSTEDIPQPLRDEFLSGSRPLMKYTNLLTFNSRAICIYITALLDCTWVYFVVEMTVLNIIYYYMKARHEMLCNRLINEIK